MGETPTPELIAPASTIRQHKEPLEITPQQSRYVALDFFRRNRPPRLRECRLFGQDPADHRPRMAPFVNQLVQHPRIRMLRGKAQTKEFQPHPCNFVDEEGTW